MNATDYPDVAEPPHEINPPTKRPMNGILLVNEIFDKGWRGYMNDTLFAVLLAFCRHTNRDGIAYPHNKTVAEAACIELNHAEDAISQLKKAGLLETVKAGGGRGNSAHRRVCLPNPPINIGSPRHKRPAKKMNSGTKKPPRERIPLSSYQNLDAITLNPPVNAH